MNLLVTRQHASLHAREYLGRVAVPVLAGLLALYLRGIQRYRFSDLSGLRDLYAELVRKRRPIIICANHLTMVDSLLIHYALQRPAAYVVHYERLSWNVPAVENAQRNLGFRLVCYLGKTVSIDRHGSARHHAQVLDTLRSLLLRSQPITMFPEGTRSRTGRIETGEVRYGVGKLLQSVPSPMVLCLYLRGRKQDSWGFAPARRDFIEVRFQLLEPCTSLDGLRGARELSQQVIQSLHRMEQDVLQSVESMPAQREVQASARGQAAAACASKTALEG